MLLVSKQNGENELLIDMDAVVAIDYNMMLVL